MEFGDLNYLAIFVAALIPMALGALWYSPLLFARPWMRAVGKTEEDVRGGARIGYLVAAVSSLVMAAVLALVLKSCGTDSLAEGALIGLVVGIGFVATTTAVNSVFAARPRELFLIDTGYHVLSLVLVGALLGAWQ